MLAGGWQLPMILEKIRQQYPELTKSQKLLADYITCSYRQAAFMTASRLADELGLNEATVIRFAQRLGYGGYPDLVEDVQALVQQELVPEDDAAQERQNQFAASLAAQIDRAQRYLAHISTEVADQVIESLSQADGVYVLGQGAGAPLAQLLSYALRSAGISAHCPPADAQGLAMVGREIGANQVLVAVSASSEGYEVANTLRYAAKKGVRTIAVSSSPISPCAQAAELALSCPPLEKAPLPSIAALAIVIDSLVHTLGARDPEAIQSHHAELAQAREYIQSARDV